MLKASGNVAASVSYTTDDAKAVAHAYLRARGDDEYYRTLVNWTGGYFPIDEFGSSWHIDVPVYLAWVKEHKSEPLRNLLIKLFDQDDLTWRECIHISNDIRKHGAVLDSTLSWLDNMNNTIKK